MGWFFRKSFKILPGVRLNVGKRTSVSIGPPGIKYNIGPGRDRLTVGIPGTGLYHSQQLGFSRFKESAQRQHMSAPLGSTGRRPVLWIVLAFVLAGLGLLFVGSQNSPTFDEPKQRSEPKEFIGPPAPPAAKVEKQSPLQRIIGKARVIDGDTINIRAIQVRLEGIDAPETEQTCTGAKGEIWQCGKTATQHLSGLIKGQDVICESTGQDRYGRMLAICRLADGTDLNAKLVRDGYALAFVRYLNRYVGEERDAKNAKRGLWAGSFQAPWDWRARITIEPQGIVSNRLQLLPDTNSTGDQKQASTPKKQNVGCSIKGNINRSGDRIYHVPGSRWYDRTQINERSGERWFCSVAEAEAAGWRAPRGRN